MDKGTLIGIASGVILLTWAISSGGSLLNFMDFQSFLIVFGGTLASTLISYPWTDFRSTGKVLRVAFTTRPVDPQSIIQTIVGFAEKARREGLLALEDAAQQLEDPFLQKGIQLIVDGTDPELVRNILETELSFLEERHKTGQGIFETMGSMAPAFGMLGTLVGLINMLKRLDDPKAIGPGMAVALITTFYGSLFANLLCLPIANKLKARSAEEILMKEVMIEGMLSIQAGENPRIIEEKLKAFLSPKVRQNIGVRKSQEAEA